MTNPDAIALAKSLTNDLAYALNQAGRFPCDAEKFAASVEVITGLTGKIAAVFNPAPVETIAPTPDEPAAEAAQQSDAVPEKVVTPTAPKAPRTRA